MDSSSSSLISTDMIADSTNRPKRKSTKTPLTACDKKQKLQNCSERNSSPQPSTSCRAQNESIQETELISHSNSNSSPQPSTSYQAQNEIDQNESTQESEFVANSDPSNERNLIKKKPAEKQLPQKLAEKKLNSDSVDEDLPSDCDNLLTHFNIDLKECEKCEKYENYESKEFDWPGIGEFTYTKPILQNVTCLEPSVRKTEIEDFYFKKSLLDSLSSKFKKMSKTQIGLLNLISDYFDVIFTKRTHENGENLRYTYSLHVLNHILKSRAKIIHNNSKLSKNPDEEYRDQGFTQTSSVILVPFRHDCYRIVSHLISLLPECVVKKKKRFEKEYGPPPPTPEQRRKKPEDYYEIFEGNIDEDFKIGLNIKNKSIALYSEFYSSDLIIASPLGLRQIIGAEGDKDRDFDFLSSVEILVIDRADVLMLQNVLHFTHVLKHFNLLPKKAHGCNFFRVRMPVLDGMAKFYRQTILLSSVEHNVFKAMWPKFCLNYSGYLTSSTVLTIPMVQRLNVPVKMCFRWFDTDNYVDEYDDRFNFFVNKVLPDYKDNDMSQTLIYIPSYFDFVKLRNYFRFNEISSVMVCEYSGKGKVAQARNNFFNGYRRFMLYTERAHFYSRYNIKGIQHILFYQLPTYPLFFQELCNLMSLSHPRRKGELKSCCVLVSKHDMLQLVHIVGWDEAKKMYFSKQKTFIDFITKSIYGAFSITA